jgi:transposase
MRKCRHLKLERNDMRGTSDEQKGVFSYVPVEKRIPLDHPIRKIKTVADRVLKRLSPVFDQMYSKVGRPSIPPEVLLKSQILIALYSLRSERQFCERLQYDILFMWFVDMEMDDDGFDATTFTKNRDRLMEHEVSRLFFDEVLEEAGKNKLLSDDHFTVDGTLIEAWASMKSFKKKDSEDNDKHDDDDPGNPSVDFHGEKRSNATHQSTTDPEALLAKKGKGKEAKLCFMGHALMENRSGLCLDVMVTQADGYAEREAATAMLDDYKHRKERYPKSLGADKGYHTKDFIDDLRERKVKPHVAMVDGRKTPGLDGRTTRTKGYKISQRKRKRVEEIFGWGKTIAGLRKTRFKGVNLTQEFLQLVGATYNLLRMAKLQPA